MTKCPKCDEGRFIRITDINPLIEQYVCPHCNYYESTSEAFRLCPSMFQSLGARVLNDLEGELSMFGLTPSDAQSWAEGELTFAKRIFTPLDTKRQLYRTS